MTEKTASGRSAVPSPRGGLSSDERLARRAARGDRRAFAAIFQRYQQDLYRFCQAIVGNPQDAQDALQNTMVKVLSALPGEKREIKLKPWLYRIANNESIEILRRRRPSESIEADLEKTGRAPVATAAGPAEAVALREQVQGLVADLAQLPERQRAALVMREMGDLEFDQIAAALGTSPQVVRQTLYEARLGLRQMEAGREMSCDKVTRALSDADGRVLRRRDLRAHLKSCAECRAFQAAIGRRRRDFAALAPLPPAAALAMLQGAFSAGSGGAAATGGAGAVASGAGTVASSAASAAGGGAATGSAAAGVASAGLGAGKAIGISALVKSAATVAVAAAIGITAADRTGLINTPLPGGPIAGGKQAEPVQGPKRAASDAITPESTNSDQGHGSQAAKNPHASQGSGQAQVNREPRARQHGAGSAHDQVESQHGAGAPHSNPAAPPNTPGHSPASGHPHEPGHPASHRHPSTASGHGQQAAAAQGNGAGRGGSSAEPAGGNGSATGAAHSAGSPAPNGTPHSNTSQPGAPDKGQSEPLQPSNESEGTGASAQTGRPTSKEAR